MQIAAKSGWIVGGKDGGNKHSNNLSETFAISSVDRIVAYLLDGNDQYNGGEGGSDAGTDYLQTGRGDKLKS